MEQIVLSEAFMEAMSRMDTVYQKETVDAMRLLSTDRSLRNLHYEKLKGRKDNLHTIRTNKGVRIFLLPYPKRQGYLFLHIDQHDGYDNWAERHTVSQNDLSGVIQIVTVSEEKPDPVESGLFSADKYSDKSLLGLGVPKEQLPLVRSIQDENDLERRLECFPADARNHLMELATGTPLSVLLDQVRENKAAAGGDPLRNPETLRSFLVLPNEPEELSEAILNGSLEEWRVFLHPRQRALVEKRFPGPALVLGGAGTGKTIVALHRTKALVDRMTAEKAEGRILYTFYNTHLDSEIRDKLYKIGPNIPRNCVDILNIDKLPRRLTEFPGYEQARILYSEDKELGQLWESAISAGAPGDVRSAKFYQEEWENVVAEHCAFTKEEYLGVYRKGRKTPLTRAQREEVWKVFEAYWELMRERRQYDVNTAMHLYRLCVAERPDLQYRHIIVDEAQDISASKLRLLRALAGPEHEDDIFLVGDTRQRIYDRPATLSECGIQVKSRTSLLYMNYRTTYEIQKAAARLFGDEPYEDMSGNPFKDYSCSSCTFGLPPQISLFDSEAEEIKWIASEMRRLIKDGVPAQNICLTAVDNKKLTSYTGQLEAQRIRTYELKNTKAEDRGLDGIRAGTMHRVKGLEFQYMFIAGINHEVLPFKPASQCKSSAEKERLKREKCLLYVAMTRAQKEAYISGYGKIQSGFLKALLGNG